MELSAVNADRWLNRENENFQPNLKVSKSIKVPLDSASRAATSHTPIPGLPSTPQLLPDKQTLPCFIRELHKPRYHQRKPASVGDGS